MPNTKTVQNSCFLKKIISMSDSFMLRMGLCLAYVSTALSYATSPVTVLRSPNWPKDRLGDGLQPEAGCQSSISGSQSSIGKKGQIPDGNKLNFNFDASIPCPNPSITLPPPGPQATRVSREFLVGFKGIGKNFKGNFREVSNVFQESFKGVSRNFGGCFKED